MSEEFEIFLKAQMQEAYMKNLQDFVKQERSKKEIYPSPKLVLNAIKSTEYWSIKVVIVGTEPYNLPNMDMGIAFSSLGQNVPYELAEIQREIRRDLYPPPFKPDCLLFKTNNLTQWMDQGVFMINTVLTAEREVKGAHKGKGWEQFTANLIQMLNGHYARLVFMFWGSDAAHYSKYIDAEKHLILKAPAPGSGKFYGCGHFLKANEFIIKNAKYPHIGINWHLLN